MAAALQRWLVAGRHAESMTEGATIRCLLAGFSSLEGIRNPVLLHRGSCPVLAGSNQPVGGRAPGPVLPAACDTGGQYPPLRGGRTAPSAPTLPEIAGAGSSIPSFS